ncbi:oxidoreductase [Pseudoclavibacter endophyticus]|uniref:Aldo/keto reductase n=1 Tax=Pseudoclavibacter endophyticus TaxID=1778590 RepID=A0A6H9WKT3_9MICO|nr:aldo/keto reductase [Pseudoclavibacter endophyticus]KAB1649763.1 aldo/keto reductase [Pseudoclavibacter endophyticus]GGA59935.1 oxidoreductase [Pseudoclavibacter endophyticus]
MKLERVGSSGLKVSELVLGCMSFGTPGTGNYPWSLPESEARAFFELALESGITTFDTADAYSFGASEEITGRLLGELVNRDDVVICTKTFFPTRESAYARGLSRKRIIEAVDASLRRLGTDYIDLYQIHRFDPETPVEETLTALHDVVKAGKVRYLGASSMAAWQFATLQFTAKLAGLTPFIAMQDQYNLLQREEEREMHPFCADQGIGVLAWSPLARGRLTRDWDATSERRETDRQGSRLYRQAEQTDREIAQAVAEIAADRGVSRAQVALAWVRGRKAVTAPIVGATKRQHLAEAIEAMALELTTDEIARLEASYAPRKPEGY